MRRGFALFGNVGSSLTIALLPRAVLREWKNAPAGSLLGSEQSNSINPIMGF